MANDLQTIFELSSKADDKEAMQTSPESQRNNLSYHQPRRSQLVLDQDLNCFPYPVTVSSSMEMEDQQIERSSSGYCPNIFIIKHMRVNSLVAVLGLVVGLTVVGSLVRSRDKQEQQ